MSFGEVLKRLRESKGMTVNQLGMYSGISGASISRYENGERGVPKPPTIEKLAKGLKVEYEELMIAAGHMKEESKNNIEETQREFIDPLRIFELVDKYTDDEIIEKFIHTSDDKKISPDKVRALLSYARFLKNQN